jgi:hypothetical protein
VDAICDRSAPLESFVLLETAVLAAKTNKAELELAAVELCEPESLFSFRSLYDLAFEISFAFS